MPSLFLLLERWSICCSNQHLRGKSVLEGNEVVMWLAIKFSYLKLCKLQKVGYLKKLEKISLRSLRYILYIISSIYYGGTKPLFRTTVFDGTSTKAPANKNIARAPF